MNLNLIKQALLTLTLSFSVLGFGIAVGTLMWGSIQLGGTYIQHLDCQLKAHLDQPSYFCDPHD